MSSFCDDDLSTGVLLFRYCNLTEAAFIRGDTNAESITFSKCFTIKKWSKISVIIIVKEYLI